jgi:group I intron endonuclease
LNKFILVLILLYGLYTVDFIIKTDHLEELKTLISRMSLLYFNKVCNLVNCILEGGALKISSIGILPIKIYSDLSQHEEFKTELYRMGGVYGFVNMSDKKVRKKYIGSSKDLYQRFLDHFKGRDSNIRLQRSIAKYGIENFNFVIYYWDKDPNIKLTDIETEVIKSFPFKELYNFKKEATSSLGYKHTKEAIKKMKLRFLDKTKHPMYGKTHNAFALEKISKPGSLNPMFNKKHKMDTKYKISLSQSKKPLALFDENQTFIRTFLNQVELADYLKLHKTTIGRYLKSGKKLLNKYYISYMIK